MLELYQRFGIILHHRCEPLLVAFTQTLYVLVEGGSGRIQVMK